MADRWTQLTPAQARSRRRRRGVEVLGAILLVGGVAAGIGAFFANVVFAPQPEDGYHLVDATCIVDPSDSRSATLLLTLEHLDSPESPAVLYADVSTQGGVRRGATRDLDRTVSIGSQLRIPIGKDAAAETVTSPSVRIGWTSGEPGWYQDVPLALVWDDRGCAISKF